MADGPAQIEPEQITQADWDAAGKDEQPTPQVEPEPIKPEDWENADKENAKNPPIIGVEPTFPATPPAEPAGPPAESPVETSKGGFRG